MSKSAIQKSTYTRLVKFANSNGSPAMIGTVIGSLDEKTIQLYLAHMKATDAKLFKTWGSKYVREDDDPTADLDDVDDPTADLEDIDDPTADLDDEPPARTKTAVKEKTGKKEKTAGLDDLFNEPAAPVHEVKLTPRKEAVDMAARTIPPGMMAIDGKLYPQRFRLRRPDGFDTDLEVFSKNPEWGILVRVPVPTDIRRILLPGGEVEVDLLVLRREPEGSTTLNGKKYSNSKLIAAAELAME